MRIKPFDIILIGFFLVCAIAMGALYFKLDKAGKECLQNPLVFAAQQQDKIGLDLTCMCSLDKPGYAPFTVSKHGLKAIFEPEPESSKVNISLFEGVFTNRS